jgi:hypothetical protein
MTENVVVLQVRIRRLEERVVVVFAIEDEGLGRACNL